MGVSQHSKGNVKIMGSGCVPYSSLIAQAVHARAWDSGHPLIRFNYISTRCSSVSCIKAARQS